MSLIDFKPGLPSPASNHAEVFGIPLVRGGIVGIEFKGLLEFGLAAGKIPVVLHLDTAENGVGMSQGGIEAKGFAGCDAGFGEVL